MKNGIITSLRHVTDDPSRDAPIQEMWSARFGSRPELFRTPAVFLIMILQWSYGNQIQRNIWTNMVVQMFTLVVRRSTYVPTASLLHICCTFGAHEYAAANHMTMSITLIGDEIISIACFEDIVSQTVKILRRLLSLLWFWRHWILLCVFWIRLK
jgi:hypothetical protein